MIHDLTTEELSQLISEHEGEIQDAISGLVMDLIDAGRIRIHRNWSNAQEREQIARMAAKVAVLSVLTNDWCDLPDEVRWIHVERGAAA